MVRLHTSIAQYRSGILKRLMVLLALLVWMVTVAACGRAQEPQVYTRVSVIYPHYDDGYWSCIMEGMDDRLDEAKAAGLDIRYYFPQINYSSEEMADLIRQQVASKVDVIVAQGSENEQFLSALQLAQEEGIRIVLMDTDSTQIGDHLYIGSDNYAIGRKMGEELVQTAADCETVAVVTGSDEYSNLQERLQGLQDVVEESGSLQITEVLEDRFDSTTFMQCYQDARDNDVLVCIEGTGALTISEVIHSMDDKHYQYVFGMDDVKAVPDGYIDGVLMQETEEIGSRVIEELIRYKETGSYSADHINTGIYWVTQDNYDEAAQHE